MRNSTQKAHQCSKLKKPSRNPIWAGVVFIFIAALTLILISPTDTKAQTSTSSNATSTNQISTQSQREQLEAKLEEIKLKIKELEQTKSEISSKRITLQSEVDQLDAKINTLNLQIESVQLSLQKLNQDIYETQRQINRTQNQIEEHKKALENGIQKMYEAENQSLIAILLSNNRISDFFNSLNNILLVQNNVQGSLENVVNLRQDLIEQKSRLSQERQDVENLKAIRQNQKQQLNVTQNQKEQVLVKTREQESEYQQQIQETRKTAAEIRSQIFKLVGGGELTFETAYDLAKLAEGATGVRAALIMAILDRESLLGKNVGSCTYEEAMHPDRDVPVFMEITDTLDIDPSSTVARVSCPITQHGSYGGAMGPSQFIPSTWAIYSGYEKENGNWAYNPGEDRIRKAVGDNDPSNPWNNTDAFVATALYIKDLYDSRTCTNYADGLDHKYPRQELQEECATSRYYAGGSWRHYYNFYGIPVVAKADEIQQDINILEEEG